MGEGSWNRILQLARDAAECFSHQCDIFTHVKVFCCLSQLYDKKSLYLYSKNETVFRYTLYKCFPLHLNILRGNTINISKIELLNSKISSPTTIQKGLVYMTTSCRTITQVVLCTLTIT